MEVSVFAPASIGNLSVGFDVLGMAVRPVDGTLLGDVVSVSAAEADELKVVGVFADKLPATPEQNIVWQCLQLFNRQRRERQLPVQPLLITLDKKMPVGSGLGSSACSVVAALQALNLYYQQAVDGQAHFSRELMLRLMGQMEAQISGSLHYDNVAPCYYGGLQLMVPDADIISRSLPAFADCYYVMAYPGIEVSTKAARDVLPTQYSRSEVIQYGQNLATFVDACHRGDRQQAFSVLNDVVAEPYRQSLLPGYNEAKCHLQAQGCLAVGISGSGPTLFAVCSDKESAEYSACWLQQHYLQTDSGFVHICELDRQGAGQISLD